MALLLGGIVIGGLIIWRIALEGILLMAIFSKKSGPEVDLAYKPKVFCKSVGEGFIDDAGIWHVTEYQAKYAFAIRHIESRINEVALTMSRLTSGSSQVWTHQIVKEPDTIRAMAIIGSQIDQ